MTKQATIDPALLAKLTASINNEISHYAHVDHDTGSIMITVEMDGMHRVRDIQLTQAFLKSYTDPERLSLELLKALRLTSLQVEQTSKKIMDDFKNNIAVTTRKGPTNKRSWR